MTQRNESKPDILTNGDADKASLDTIRRLLLAPEQRSLSELHEKVESAQLDSDRLSRLLPESITKARESGDELSQSLGPVVDGAIKESIKNDPESLAEAISPIMMPAIRRAVMQMISGMADSFNRTLEQSLSGQGIKWRIEALRTGRSFSEVAMFHSLVYRVEQVFLIHRETGLKLAHVTDTGGEIIDADMVSGMLTAIQDFVRDSFSDGKRELLNTMDCDQHDVLIEYGSKAILAAVVSGVASPDLRNKLAVTLDNIHATHAGLLEDFEGDSEPFVVTHPQLELCLESQQKGRAEDTTDSPVQKGLMARYGWAIPVAILFGLLTWAALWYRAGQRVDSFANATVMPTTVSADYDSGTVRLSGSAHHDWLQNIHERTARLDWLKGVNTDEVSNLDEPWLTFLDQLNQQPGITVTSSERIGNRYRLSGLRDPLAVNPAAVLSETDLRPENVEMSWSPYQALDQPITEQRVQNKLDPPDSVSLNWQGNKLIVTGTSSDSWWRMARQRAVAILSPDQIDSSALQLSNSKIDAYLARLDSEPGIVVTSTEWHDGSLVIDVKRDDYAVDPIDSTEFGLGTHEANTNWTSFVSDDPVIVERRLRGELRLPESVAVSVRNGTPHLIGTANLNWLRGLQERIDEADNIETVEYTEIAPDGIEELTAVRGAIDDGIIYFNANSVQISSDELQSIQELKKNIRKLVELAERFDRSLQIQIIGRTATTAPQKALSLERCREVKSELLLNSGFSDSLFDMTWRDDEVAGPAFQDKQRGRVMFHVVERSS